MTKRTGGGGIIKRFGIQGLGHLRSAALPGQRCRRWWPGRRGSCSSTFWATARVGEPGCSVCGAGRRYGPGRPRRGEGKGDGGQGWLRAGERPGGDGRSLLPGEGVLLGVECVGACPSVSVGCFQHSSLGLRVFACRLLFWRPTWFFFPLEAALFFLAYTYLTPTLEDKRFKMLRGRDFKMHCAVGRTAGRMWRLV